jgi:Zn-dependent peptidase ImmA (M78 family)/transcriptional regulator with XRE-family HTH domain
MFTKKTILWYICKVLRIYSLPTVSKEAGENAPTTKQIKPQGRFHMIIPERLHQIRLARGYSLDQLVARMGGMVTKQSLSQYEKGKNQPRPAVALQIARALDVKTSDLTIPAPVVVEYLGFRRRSGMTATLEDSIKSQIAFGLEQRVYLQEMIHPGDTNRFRFDRFPVSTLAEVEGVAEQVRDKMGVGRDAIGNVTETLERHGVHVFALDTEEKFDGISALVRKDNEIVATGIISRSGVCGERQRFTRAHEAGHLFTQVAPGLDEESVANRFAGAFLLPADTLREEIGTTRKTITTEELLTLKARYGISLQALARRLLDVDIINPTLYKEWCISISKKGWRKEEPRPLQPETSSWLRQTVLRAHAEGLMTTQGAEEMLGEKIGGELPALTRLRAFRQLPLEERRRMLEKSSEKMADLYLADLAKPPHERELTAFTALDGIDPILEDEVESQEKKLSSGGHTSR